jgi:pyrrolidone-carboxylate peptidase
MSILLTGFEKFSKYNNNLSELLVDKFPDNFYDLSVEKLIFPVNWKQSCHLIKQKIENMDYLPSIFVLTGIQEANYISLEDRAYNFKFGMDEEKHFKCSFITIRNGLCLKSNVDVERLLKRIKAYERIRISVYPGIYLCNYIYYLTLNYYKRCSYVLFVHFPKAGSFYNCFRALNSIIINLINMYKV